MKPRPVSQSSEELDDDHFRTVVPPRHRGGFPGKSPADNHDGPVLLIQPAGIGREHSLIRSIQTIQNARNPPLSAVGMPGEHQIEIILAVYIDQFRAVCQQNRICFFVHPCCNLPDLRTKTAFCSLFETVNICPGVWIIHAADGDAIPVDFKCGNLAAEAGNAAFRQFSHLFCKPCSSAPVFMIAGHIIAGVLSADAFQKSDGIVIRKIVIEDIAAQKDQVRRFSMEGIQQLVLTLSVSTGVQIRDECNADRLRDTGMIQRIAANDQGIVKIGTFRFFFLSEPLKNSNLKRTFPYAGRIVS